MSIPLVRNNTKDAINTSIIAIKKNLERINSLLGLADSSEPDLSGLATKQELEDAVTEINNTIDEVETSLAPVDSITSGDMHAVTSNAVANSNAMPVDTVTSGDMHSVTSNAVANSKSYSTTEQLTGGKWIDGKPIYRKVFNLSKTLSSVSTSLLQNMNIAQILRNDLQIFNNNQMYFVTNGILFNANTKLISFNTSYSSLWVYNYIIEYTKTTD